jgi:chromosome segregation ATPase
MRLYAKSLFILATVSLLAPAPAESQSKVGSSGDSHDHAEEPPIPRDCRIPLKIKIDRVDYGFGRHIAELESDLKKVIEMWNHASGRPLLEQIGFRSDQKADVTLNFIFDERQAMMNEKRDVASKVKELNQLASDNHELNSELSSLNAAKSAHNARLRDYDTRVDELNKLGSEFENRLNDLLASLEIARAKVQRGSMSTQRYNQLARKSRRQLQDIEIRRESLRAQAMKLESERTRLHEERQRLEAWRKQLNTKYSVQIADTQNLEAEAERVNKQIKELNSKLKNGFVEGETRRVVQGGKMVPQEISIYEFHDEINLQRVLAHELGHALGLNHVPNAESIMYWQNAGRTVALTQEDLSALRMLCSETPGR